MLPYDLSFILNQILIVDDETVEAQKRDAWSQVNQNPDCLQGLKIINHTLAINKGWSQIREERRKGQITFTLSTYKTCSDTLRKETNPELLQNRMIEVEKVYLRTWFIFYNFHLMSFCSKTKAFVSDWSVMSYNGYTSTHLSTGLRGYVFRANRNCVVIGCFRPPRKFADDSTSY